MTSVERGSEGVGQFLTKGREVAWIWYCTYLGFSFFQASTRVLMLWLSIRSLMRTSALHLQHFLVTVRNFFNGVDELLFNSLKSSSTAHGLQTSRPQHGITCGLERGNSHTWQRSAAGHCMGAG